MGKHPYEPAAPLDLQDYLKALAAMRLGVPAASLVTLFRSFAAEMDQGLPSQTVGGTGSRNAQTGCIRLSSGGTANSGWEVWGGGSGPPPVATLTPKIIPGGAGVKWLMQSRFKIGAGAAVDAQDMRIVGASTTAANQLRMGVRGATSTTNFTLSAAAGATIDSGIAIDNNWNDHCAWRDATNSYYQISANAPVQGTAQAAADASPYMVALNGTTATDRFMDVAYWFFAAVLAP